MDLGYCRLSIGAKQYMNYDLLVIGGGPGGCRAAEYAAANGLKTALFEKEELGGVCLNHGCIPTKTLLYAARLHDHMKYDAPMFGVSVDNLRLDSHVLWRRKEGTIRRLRAALKQRLQKAGVEVITGEAEFIGKSRAGFAVNVSGKQYLGKNLIRATGGRPHIPQIQGLQDALRSGLAVTPREILATPEIPAKLLILGGGTIGIEFATFYRSAGADVTIVEQASSIGGKLDPRLSDFLLKRLQKRGIRFTLNSRIADICGKQITLNDGTHFETDRLLLACGWEAPSGPATIDATLKCPDGTFTIGDATGRYFLAPVAEREAEAAVNQILGKSDTVDYSWIPHVIFSDPEIAAAGLTLAEAQENDLSAFEKQFPLCFSGRYVVEYPAENGFGIGVYSGNGRLLGVHFAGNGVIELLGATLSQVHIPMMPHPCLVEIVQNIG